MSSRKLTIHLSQRDRERLELIKVAFGVSLSAAVRVSIRSAAERLGLEVGNSKEFLRDVGKSLSL